MDLKMTQEQLEAYLRSLPEDARGDVVIDRNPQIPTGPVFVNPQYVPMQDPEVAELIRQKEAVEEAIDELEMDEPMEVDYDSYDLYDIEHDAWDQRMEELREELEELEDEIEART